MKIRFLLLALLAFSLSGCVDTISGRRVAEPEVARFHEMLKRRDFEAMYAATGEQFKLLATDAPRARLIESTTYKLTKCSFSHRPSYEP